METEPTRMCELLIGLPEVKILGVDDVAGGSLFVEIETRSVRPGCPSCGVPARVKDRDPVLLVDLPAFGRRTRFGRYWDLVTLSIFGQQWEASDLGGSTSALRIGRVNPPGETLGLSLDEFSRLLVDELGLKIRGIEGIETTARLADIGLDSLDMLQLLDLVQELGGDVEMYLPSSVETIRDAYDLYCTLCSQPKT